MKPLCPRHIGWIVLFIFALGGSCKAQDASDLIPLFDVDSSPAYVSGVNFTINSSTQHSSLTGWSSVVIPDISYRFNRHYSVDIKFPWFLSVKNFVPKTVKNVLTYPLTQTKDVIGDTAASGYYKRDFGDFGYKARATVGLATGDSLFGLSANTATYNVTNHLEYSISRFSPDIEFGIGNSSSLLHPTITKSYTAVGQLANFQAGADIDLPYKLDLDLEAYENLPLGNQNVYGTITTKGKNGKTTTTQVLEGQGVAEDNGFTADLEIPLNSHFILAAGYQRSLDQGTDELDISLIWKLRTPKKHTKAAH